MRIESSYHSFLNIRTRMLAMLHTMSNPYPVEERIRHAMEGSIKFSDCFVVQHILNQKKPLRCLEIGSFLGFSTRWLLESGQEWRMHVTAVDPNIRHRIFDNPRWMVEGLNAEDYMDRLEIISAFFGAHGLWSSDYEIYEPKRSHEWVSNLLSTRKELDKNWTQRFDCIYIDADHTYNAVMDGFFNALPLLNPGGMILFHDAITWNGVNQALMNIREEFKNRAHVEIIDSSNIFDHPMLANEPSNVSDGIGIFQLL